MPQRFAEPRPLTQRLTQRLLAYATVAGAAATCATRAQAEVVYTPIDRPIHSNYFLDLNHDGIDDFQITSYFYSGLGEVQIFGAQSNRMVAAATHTCGIRTDTSAPAPLRAGALIGPGKPFEANATCMAFYNYSGGNGPWLDVRDRFAGFAFFIDGREHFGWARLSVNRFLFNGTARIEGYAYETIPGKPIVAGDEGNPTKVSTQPGTLGALAVGAAKF
ncbi:MAG: hypothetical protein WAL56_20805 [Candidatus Sulfotelmatobacter sp.]